MGVETIKMDGIELSINSTVQPTTNRRRQKPEEELNPFDPGKIPRNEDGSIKLGTLSEEQLLYYSVTPHSELGIDENI